MLKKLNKITLNVTFLSIIIIYVNNIVDQSMKIAAGYKYQCITLPIIRHITLQQFVRKQPRNHIPSTSVLKSDCL